MSWVLLLALGCSKPAAAPEPATEVEACAAACVDRNQARPVAAEVIEAECRAQCASEASD